MITIGELLCPDCNGQLRYYDKVKRIIRTKKRTTTYLVIKRYRCQKCGKMHRELPEEIIPFKQYEKEVIEGVLDGLITSETLGFEDYPCEMTMIRWKKLSSLTT